MRKWLEIIQQAVVKICHGDVCSISSLSLSFSSVWVTLGSFSLCVCVQTSCCHFTACHAKLDTLRHTSRLNWLHRRCVPPSAACWQIHHLVTSFPRVLQFVFSECVSESVYRSARYFWMMSVSVKKTLRYLGNVWVQNVLEQAIQLWPAVGLGHGLVLAPCGLVLVYFSSFLGSKCAWTLNTSLLIVLFTPFNLSY